ncbi:hypothetical protein Hypma_007074 [Hypsizygus marmoreus]|uniref:F-box domain-containing protein n=1 Tax=Hypsizygus marmoreus TaxID=39966 RepID=A0A369KA41_HYPMA|nr:hypothetical protein Hypma_007074 [Hypsizygus marmoreus]
MTLSFWFAPFQSRLPQELLDLIVDGLKGDYATLRTIALAARPFLRQAQKNIFSSVDLTNSSLCSRLHHTLIANAALIRHIRRINILEMDGVPLWTVTDTTLPLILKLKLDCVRHIELGYRIYRPDTSMIIPWRDLLGETKMALMGVFALPELSKIVVTDVHGLPMTFFNCVKTLKRRLTIYNVAFEDDTNFDISSTPEASAFAALDLDRVPANPQLIKLIARPNSCLANVPTLAIFPGETEDTIDIPTSIMGARGNVPYVRWDIENQDFPRECEKHDSRSPVAAHFRRNDYLVPLPNQLATMRNLVSFTYAFRVSGHLKTELIRRCDTCLEPLLTSLEHSFTDTLKHLVILIDVAKEPNPDLQKTLDALSCSQRWESLDKILASRILVKLYLEVRSYNDDNRDTWYRDNALWEQRLGMEMSRMNAKRRLWACVCPYE